MAERKDVYQLAEMTRDDVGSATVTPAELTIGEPATLVITYTVGEAGLRKGGRLSIARPYGWTAPQDDDPAAAAALTLTCSRTDVHLKMRTHSWRPGKFNQQWGAESSRFDNFWILVTGRDLEPGDTIRIVWGDTSHGGPGMWPAPLEIEMHLPICVWTGDGPSEFFFIRQPVKVRVRGGRAERLAVTIPSVLRPGEAGDLWIGGRDRCGEVSSGPLGRATVEDGSGLGVSLPEARNQVRLPGRVRFPEEGTHRVPVRAGAVEGTSNPVEVRPDGPRIFWGDPHVHTALSDGLGTMDEAYQYAREVGGLDFCALADHMDARGDGPERFRQLQACAAKYNEPGTFVTFSGFEGTRYEGTGDINLYFRHDRAPMLWHDGDERRQPADVMRAFSPDELLAVPHPHIGVNWDQVLPEYCRLYEIYSVWGNSEFFGCPRMNVGLRKPADCLQHGLSKGLRLGIIAGGDDHAGHSGNSRWLRTASSYPNGLTAVHADELTRDALFDALCARRAYATTGARIIVHFRVNDVAMGGEGPAAGSRTVRAEVHGTADLSSLAVVRNGTEVHCTEPGGLDTEIEWTDSEPFAAAAMRGKRWPVPFIYYYLRVTQADGQMAWSSPVWFSDPVEAERQSTSARD